MSAEPMQAGLARAQRAIAETYDELCRTLEGVNELAAEGAPDAALRLVELQRSALDDLVARVARDVAAVPSGRNRRRVRAAVGAALAAAAALAGLMFAGTDTPLDRELARAEAIEDPALRLEAVEALYRESFARPDDAGEGFSARVVAVASRIADEGKRDEQGGSNRDIVSRAARLAASASSRDPDTNPPPPPSQGQSPIDEIKGSIRRL